MSDPEEEFQALSDELQEKANAVRCSPEEYRHGLQGIIADCETAIMASLETSP